MSTTTEPKKSLTWLITGSSSGFGLSLSLLALSQGHTVIATSRSPHPPPALLSLLSSQNPEGGSGNKSKWLSLDVTSSNTPQLIEDLSRSGYEIDVLVNNAGFCIISPVETATEDELRSQMDTLYFGPLRLIRAVLPLMRKRRQGTIVNISSGAALEGAPSMGGYAGAKAALDSLAKVLVKEVAAFNIRILTVVPGTFNTNFNNAGFVGKAPLPEDYKGTMVEKMIQIISSGKLVPNGDKDKAMKALYEVVVGEGVGAGHEAERLLPLGSDMTPRLKGTAEYLLHALEVFGDVTNNVNVDK